MGVKSISQVYIKLVIYLPCGMFMVRKLIKSVGIIDLQDIAEVKEGKKKAEPTPHPRVEAFNSNIHVMSFAQCLQPVQYSLLVPELKVLHNT